MNSNRKGYRGEYEALHLLQEHGIHARRNNQRVEGGGFRNPDIAATVAGIPLHIEVKRQERLRLNEAVTQAVDDADGIALPVVLHRQNNRPWLVTVRLYDLIRLMEDVKEVREHAC